MTKQEEQAILNKPLDECTEDELRLRLQIMEAQMLKMNQSFMSTDLEGIGPDDEIECDVPIGPRGEVYKINEVPYFGRIVLKRRTAQQLASMVSESYRIERELNMSRGNANRQSGAMLHGEELLKMRRFQQIMKGGEADG